MQIYGPRGADRSDPVYLKRIVAKIRAGASSGGQGTDEVEISDVGRFLSYLSQLPQIRKDRVDALRREIERGTYDYESKIDEIVDSILEDLGLPPAKAES